jgi:hypothetical protein
MKVGDKIKDNDPRIPYARVLTVIEVGETHVMAVHGNFRPVRIRIDRVFPFLAGRKIGFTLIDSEDER